MALSDYVTGDEWDAMYYVCMSDTKHSNFGEAMHTTIDALLATGYKFTGLDDKGQKLKQVENGVNAEKITLFLGQSTVDALAILDNGRNFIKRHLPTFVRESDNEWINALQYAHKMKSRQQPPAHPDQSPADIDIRNVSVTDITSGDYVRTAAGLLKIRSTYGITDDGQLAKPSDGGFGVITEDGGTTTMWQALSYHKAADVHSQET